MTKKEKLVMSYLCERCQKKKTYLISPQEITSALSKKYVLSIDEIDEIMVGLSNANFIDFVISDGKKGYMYCVTLKSAGRLIFPMLKIKERRWVSWCYALFFLPLSVLSLVSF